MDTTRTMRPSAPIMRRRQLSSGVCVEGRQLRERVCATLVAADHIVSARVESVEQLLASSDGSPPDCVVIGARRPDPAAVTRLRLIRSELGSCGCVLVCEGAGSTEVRRALQLGVDGVVLSDQLEDVLGLVVAAVCAGQVSVPRERRAELGSQALTNREKQVLRLVIGGLTNGQIAARLYLAESTVKSHLSSAFSKLGVTSRNEAAALILDPDYGRGLGVLRIRSDRSRAGA
jgi:DNA-binding NarL/FixJ family response regulator